MSVPQSIRGRVMSVTMMVHALIPIGVIPVSALAEFAGIDVALMTSAGVLVIGLWLLSLRFPGVGQIDRGYLR